MSVMANRFYFSAVLIICCFSTKAQLIENTASFRNIQSKKYFRFHYDNDFFTKADYYYSQGIMLEYVNPGVKKFILTKLLPQPKGYFYKYGVGLNLLGYTPTSTESDNILYEDRPYASCIILKTFAAGINETKKQRFYAALNAGIIGPAALGKQIQTNIHRWLKNPLPHGWQYQIKNDAVINYTLGTEKKLTGDGNHFLANGLAEIQAGTLNDRVSGGFNFIAGNFNNPFVNSLSSTKKIEYYFYGQAKANIIGYDAAMQGGIFNRSSPYIIAAKDISRITFQADAGVIVNFKKVFFSYTQSFLTKEFRTGLYHRWGGVSLGVGF